MKTTKAILLVSFGTSYLESKEKAIDKLLAKIEGQFPGCPTYQAWTSRTILSILKKQSGLAIPTIEEAMASIQTDGMETLIVQPTYFINGLENRKMQQLVRLNASPSLSLCFGAPLLAATEDLNAVLKAVVREFAWLPRDEALVLMGHGSPDCANSAYAALDGMLKRMGYGNFFVGSIEGSPSLGHTMQQIAPLNPKKIHLTPFMLVAGGHAHKDMAGNQRDSWKSLLEAAGYEVECHLKGLGEYDEIQNIYLRHLKKAMEEEVGS